MKEEWNIEESEKCIRANAMEHQAFKDVNVRHKNDSRFDTGLEKKN